MKKYYQFLSFSVLVAITATGRTTTNLPLVNQLTKERLCSKQNLCNSSSLSAAQQSMKQKAAVGFMENKGQITNQNGTPNPAVLYLYSSPGLNVQLKKDGFAYDTYAIEEQVLKSSVQDNSSQMPHDIKQETYQSKSIYHYHRIDINFEGSNPNIQVIPYGPSTDYSSYYNVSEATHVYHYQKVVYKNLYPNIDAEFVVYGSFGNASKPFEYNFIIHPGGDPSQIKMRYLGAPVSIKKGKLRFALKQGLMEESIPESWEEQNGDKEFIKVNYKKIDDNLIGFSGYTHTTKTLIIDPTPDLLWGTYYGGTGDDFGYDITTDAAGNSYITGETSSSTAIATSGAYQTTYGGGSKDAFVIKFNSNGVRQWATYYGGTGDDTGYGISTDGSGDVYVTGTTTSANPTFTTSGAHQTTYGGSNDAFIVKFNSSGVRQWGTYYGGIGYDYGYSISTDGSNNIYVSGWTSSANAITTSGTHQTTYGGGSNDAFMVKFNSSGNRQWGTYYGGTLDDRGRGIAVDGSGNIYITGYSSSTNAVSTSGTHQTSNGGGYDAFVVKFDNTGIRQWGTYYGDNGNEFGMDIAVDGSGNVFSTGWTTSSAAIATSGAHQSSYGGGANDAYIVKFDANGVRQWSTYYGGTGSDVSNGIALDGSGNVYVSGYSVSTNAIVTSGAYQTAYGGGIYDAFVVKLDNNGVRQWGTYYGGGLNDMAQTIAIDPSNTIYITGWTVSTSAIATSGAHQTSHGGSSNDAFVAKLSNCGTSAPAQPGSITGNTVVCSGATATYSVAPVSGATSYAWLLPSGWTGTSTTNSISVTAGASSGTMNVTANNACASSPSQSLVITVNTTPAQPTNINGSTNICSGPSSSYSVAPISGASSYIWTLPSGWTGSSTTNNISVTPNTNSGTITVSATNGCGTSATKSLAINVSAGTPSQPSAINGNATICSGYLTTYSVAPVSNATSYVWTLPSDWFGSSTSNTISVVTGTNGGTVYVGVSNACASSMTQSLAVNITVAPLQPGSISGNTVSCSGATSTYSVAPVSGATSYIWTLPAGWLGTSTSNSIVITSNNVSGTINVSASNACGTSSSQSVSININNVPLQPTAINGITTICYGSANTYSIVAVSGATSYTWSLPSGWTGTSTNNSITVTSNSISGTVNVSAINACGSSASQSLAINVNTMPLQPGAISGNTIICAGSANTYSVAAVSGAISYTWSLPSGWSGTSATAVINTTASASGTITVKANNACGSSATRTLGIVVNTCTGIEETGIENGVAIFPNPTHGLFTVNLQNMQIFDTEVSIVVTDVLGREIYKQLVGNVESQTVDLSEHVSGIYYVIVRTHNKVYKNKLLLVR